MSLQFHFMGSDDQNFSEEKKYELIPKGVRPNNLPHRYRIRALRDFGKVKKGQLGGYVESESNLSHEGNCWISDGAMVVGNARVSGNAIVRCAALISGEAKITDNAVIGGWVTFHENARIGGEIKMTTPRPWHVEKPNQNNQVKNRLGTNPQP